MTEPMGPPAEWPELDGGGVMSNFDHKIDQEQADLLREGGCFSRHAGWEFNGRVWFQGGRWHEQVWRYQQPCQTYSADTLEELMREVNDEWGWQ